MMLADISKTLVRKAINKAMTLLSDFMILEFSVLLLMSYKMMHKNPCYCEKKVWKAVK